MRITKKALIAALKRVDPDTELHSISSAGNIESRQGCAILAVERAFRKFAGGVEITVGMTHYTVGAGKTHEMPRWFKQLMLHLTWHPASPHMIHVGDLICGLS